MRDVLQADLRDEALVARLSSLDGPGGIRELGRALGADAWEGETVELPLRLLIIDPRPTGKGRKVTEAIVSRLLEIDPPVRAIVLLVPGVDQVNPVEHLGDGALPGLYSFPHVKVVELRGDRISLVHEGHVAQATEFPADPRWAEDYRRDVEEFLHDLQTFDRVWEAIAQGQIVSLGARIAGLGAGRDRALADAALRLAVELDPLREPATGTELPDRWKIDNELLPISESDLNAATERQEQLHLPAGVGAIARVRKVFFTSVLRPSPSRYNSIFEAIGQRLRERPERLARLLEGAERREEDGTLRIHPVAAADLDAELGGGVVYGDSYAKSYADGRDAAAQIEQMVRLAADYIGRGVAAAIPARWLRQDEESVLPEGPAEAVAMLRDLNSPWNHSARTTAADRPQGSWPSTQPLRSSFLAVGMLVAFAAGVGEPQWPLLSWVALGAGIAVPAVLSPQIRSRLDVQLLTWAIAGFTVCRLFIDPQSPTNSLLSFPQSWEMHPLLRLALCVAGGAATASAAVSLVAFEASATTVLPGPLSWMLRVGFGGLRRLIALLAVFVALCVVMNVSSTDVWSPSAIASGNYTRIDRTILAAVAAFALVRFAPAAGLITLAALWVLNPFTATPFQPNGASLPLSLDPTTRLFLAIAAGALFLFWQRRERLGQVKGAPAPFGINASKLSHWIAEAKENAAPRSLVPDQEASLAAVCHQPAVFEWAVNPEWTSLEPCGESQNVELASAKTPEPVALKSDLVIENGAAIDATAFVAKLSTMGYAPAGHPTSPGDYVLSDSGVSLMKRDQKVYRISWEGGKIHEICEVLDVDVLEREGVDGLSAEDLDETVASEDQAPARARFDAPILQLTLENLSPVEAQIPMAPKTFHWTPREARLHPAGAPWRVPETLSLFLGSPLWGSSLLSFLFLATSAMLGAALAAQIVVEVLHWLEVIKEYPVKVGPGGVDPAVAMFLQAIWLSTFVGMVSYLTASYFVAGRLREWIEGVGYGDAARALARLEALGRLSAQQDIARVSLRREYARTAGQAADLVHEASAAGASAAKSFGEDLASVSDRPRPLSGRDASSPHRQIVGIGGDLPGTDAAGIYRVYPHYTNILRRVFSAAMDLQVRERFARTRGEFFIETKDLIAEGVAMAVREKLRLIHRRGLLAGEITVAGEDLGAVVADELWADMSVRTAALNALSVKPDDAIPQLLSPGQARMLDTAVIQFVVLPQPLVHSASRLRELGVGSVIISQNLESAGVLRITPFREGFYDFGEVRGPKETEGAA